MPRGRAGIGRDRDADLRDRVTRLESLLRGFASATDSPKALSGSVRLEGIYEDAEKIGEDDQESLRTAFNDQVRYSDSWRSRMRFGLSKERMINW